MERLFEAVLGSVVEQKEGLSGFTVEYLRDDGMVERFCGIAPSDGSPDALEDEEVFSGLGVPDDLHLSERVYFAERFDLPRVKKAKGFFWHGSVYIGLVGQRGPRGMLPSSN